MTVENVQWKRSYYRFYLEPIENKYTVRGTKHLARTSNCALIRRRLLFPLASNLTPSAAQANNCWLVILIVLNYTGYIYTNPTPIYRIIPRDFVIPRGILNLNNCMKFLSSSHCDHNINRKTRHVRLWCDNALGKC